MARYKKQIQLESDKQLVSEKLTEYMKSSDYTLIDYHGQTLWRKEIKNPGRPFAPPIKVQFVFNISDTLMELEAFVIWSMWIKDDSGEHGLDRGIIGNKQKKILQNEVNLVCDFIQSLI